MQDYKFIKVGARVFWNDPAINDYPEDEREWQRLTIYTILDIKVDDGEEVNDDTIVCVRSEYGCEGEVYAEELSPAYCHLTDKQRRLVSKLREMFLVCEKANIDFVLHQESNELLLFDGSDVEEYLWDEDSSDEEFETIRMDVAGNDFICMPISKEISFCENNVWIKLKSRNNGN